MLEAALNAIVIVDADGFIVSVNSQTEALFGYRSTELQGQCVERLVPQAGRAGRTQRRMSDVGQPNTRLMGGGKDLFGLHRDGTEIPIEISLSPLQDPSGLLVLCIIRDVERRHSEAAVRELAAIVESSQDAIIGKTLTGVIASWNPAAQRLYGYAAAEIIGQSHSILAAPGLAGQVQSVIARVASGGRVEEFETLRRRKDGSLVLVELSVSPIYRTADRHIVGISTISRDITARKHAEDDLRRAKEEAERANQAKNQFLAVMSHELRTPLNAIFGMTELLLDTSIDADQRDYILTARASSDSLLTLVNDLLDFARIDAGRLRLDACEFSLRELLERTLKPLALAADRRSLQFLYEVSTDLPDILIGDDRRLQQILVNLVTNAIKYTEQGNVVVQIAGQHTTSRIIELKCTISDTGIGIPAEKQSLIFKPFEMVDNSNSRRYGGTGLGLAIAAQLAELMGGTIWVESEVGRGSTFHVAIPLRVPQSAPGTRAAPHERPNVPQP